MSTETLSRARSSGRRATIVLLALFAIFALAGARSRAQARARVASVATFGRGIPLPTFRAREVNDALHMQMTPTRPATSEDSARAATVARTLRAALAKYADTTAAVADGYRMFSPAIKNQAVYHFTNNWHGMQEAFRFDPAKPTSLLYKKDLDGRFILTGAMYTAPKRFSAAKLDERVPLSIARWHRHVNWCVPKKGETRRWLDRRDSLPVFGPASPIATKAACDAVGGTFRESLFGWMLHANVLTSDDPAIIWGDEHAGHDMHAGMKMDGM
jgi:hypothetical protein